MADDLIRVGGVLGVVLIVAIVVLSILSPGDNAVTITTIVAATMALLSFLASRANAGKIEQIHLSVNSRLDQLLKAEKDTSRAEGVAQERERGKLD